MQAAVNSTSTGGAVPWHALTVDEVLKRLTASTENGLAVGEASTRLQKYGPNRLPAGKKRGPLMRFISQFNNILVYVLLGAGFTKMMLGLWIDASIILGVVILNGLLGFIQEGKAEKALDSIRNMLSAEARTLRGGEADDPGGAARSQGHRTLESGRQSDPDLRLADDKEPADGGAASLANQCRRTDHRSCPRKSHCRRSRKHGFFRNHGGIGPPTGSSYVRRAAKRSWAVSTQLLAGVSALETPLLRQIKVRLRHHRRYRGGERAPLLLWQMGNRYGLRGDLQAVVVSRCR